MKVSKYIQDNLKYYNENYKSYENDKHKIINFEQIYQPFLQNLKQDSLILDFGCGTGRDILYFLNAGYKVEGIDGSKKMCMIAEKNTGLKIKCLNFLDFSENNKYDGIWACASLVHLNHQDLINTIRKISQSLKKGGYFYTTFKYGTFEGIRNGRYFIDMTEERFKMILKNFTDLTLIYTYYNESYVENQHNKEWINFVLQKE